MLTLMKRKLKISEIIHKIIIIKENFFYLHLEIQCCKNNFLPPTNWSALWIFNLGLILFLLKEEKESSNSKYCVLYTNHT